MRFWWADVPRICIENPIPSRVFCLPQYTQTIQPYEYGHPYSKKTCLWLKNLPPLFPTDIVTPVATWCPSGSYSKKHASSLISNRDAVASQMDTKLREVLAQYNIDLQYISVTNFDFTDIFTDAVEAKAKAQQEKEKAETDADKRRVEAQATADADLIAANAEAEKSKVAADAELYVAEKKAEANRALNDSLNSNLLEYYKITDVESRWNGELPAYVGDGNSIPIINGIN